MQQNQEHYDFIATTDRKSLHTHIKGLVATAQEVADNELKQRRLDLQKLLEYEDDIYEEEFANKVKSRIDEDIKQRKNVLLKIKAENEGSAREFLEKKRVQQYMESCYEIREALRHKEQQNVKVCQIEQILEKERQQQRERDLGKYWERVLARNQEREDQRAGIDICIKRKLAEQNKFVLDVQLQEHAEKEEELRKEKQEETDKLNKLLEEMRLEAFDRKRAGLPEKMLTYRNEMLENIAKRKADHQEAESKRIKEESEERHALEHLEEQERVAFHQRKHALHKATLEYLAYIRGLRKLEDETQQQMHARIDDLRSVDMCTKGNIKLTLERKAAAAARCHAELKRQICEQHERHLREEAERKECKMLENRFARQEMTRAELLQQRRKNRADLDKQVAELQRIRAAEEASYKQDLKLASNDPEFCAQLAVQYMAQGVDYLEPHPNWRILACPQKEFLPKAKATNIAALLGDGDSCISPCGCAKALLSGEGCGSGQGDGTC